MRPIVHRTALIAALLLAVAGASAIAQPSVAGTRSLAFGAVSRGTTGSVAYTSGSSAEFSVTGRQGRRVRISVSVTALSRTGATSLTHSINGSDCAYSIDYGVTWTSFGGSLSADVTIPNGTGNGSEGSIYVRVGGSISPTVSQNGGDYSGTVTVSSYYL